jgi:hypothetical protein
VKEIIEIHPTSVNERVIDVALDEREIMLAQYAAMGKKVSEIALQLDRSDAWVRGRKKDPRVIKLIGELQSESLEQAKRAITTNTLEAAEKIMSLMRGSLDERVQLAAAKYLLDQGIPKADPNAPPGSTFNFNFNNMTTEELMINVQQRFKTLERDD